MASNNYFDLIFLPLEATSSITGFISFVATGLFVILGFYYKIYQRVLGKLVLIVNLADFVFIFARPLSYIYKPTDDLYCRLIIAISHAALMTSFTWGVFFAHTLYETVKQQNIHPFSRFFKYYCIISVIISTALGAGVLLSDYVFYSEGEAKTCVHRVYFRKFDPTMTFLMTIPTLVLCALCIMWYILGANNMRKLFPNFQHREVIPLLLYPAIVIVCYFPALITHILIIYEIKPGEGVETFLQNLFQLHGFFNVLAYGIQPLINGSLPEAGASLSGKTSEHNSVFSRGLTFSRGITFTNSVVEMSQKS